MIPLCIDLETRPPDMTPDQMRANALTSKANPKRTDDTRAEWADDPANQITAWSRSSLSLTSARIVAWAAICDGEEVGSWSSWGDEIGGLHRLCGLIDSAPSGRVQWVGHNIAAFDLPILRIAAMRHGVRYLRDAVPTYRYAETIHDNMEQAIKPAGRINGVSADALAVSLGLDGKGEIGALDFPALYASVAAGEMAGEDAAKLLEKRARVDVGVEWATYLKMTA